MATRMSAARALVPPKFPPVPVFGGSGVDVPPVPPVTAVFVAGLVAVFVGVFVKPACVLVGRAVSVGFGVFVEVAVFVGKVVFVG
jgi:hypothetical protein